RELRNAIERAVILCEGGLIQSAHLPLDMAPARPSSIRTPSPSEGPLADPAASAHTGSTAPLGTLDAAERSMILEALAPTGQNKPRAGRLLGLTRAQLRSRIEKHGIVTPED